MDNDLKIFDEDDDFEPDNTDLSETHFQPKANNFNARRLIEMRMEEKRLEQLLKEYD